MFDIQATLRWVSAVFKDAEGAAAAYKATEPGWQTSFMQIVLPVYVASYIVAALLGVLTGSGLLLGSVLLFLFTLVWSLAWTFVIAFIFQKLADFFAEEGENGFDQAYAVVALAIIPAAAGTAISPFPWDDGRVGAGALKRVQ